TDYSQLFTASGGTGPYSFENTGSLPPGLSMYGDGFLRGTPTTSGSYNITVFAYDNGAQGCIGSRPYTVSICPAIALAPTTLNPATAFSPYNQTFTASGGQAPYSYRDTLTALPAGLSLTIGGVLSGTPTVTGTYSVTVRVQDANGCTKLQTYSLTINCP